jgi:hypothetical protein
MIGFAAVREKKGKIKFVFFFLVFVVFQVCFFVLFSNVQAVAAAGATIVIGAIDRGVGKLPSDNYPPLIVVENIPASYGSIAFLFCVALFMFPG